MVVDAVVGLVRLVEAMHVTIARVPAPLAGFAPGPARGITGLVYRSVRGVATGVGMALDLALARLVPLLGQRDSSPQREAVLAALNGVLGDYLADTGNPLAIPMSLRREGAPIEPERCALQAAFPGAGPGLLVAVHGLCMNDLHWRSRGQDALPALARASGWTDVYLHYNTGLHVSENGRSFAALLERVLDQWPVPAESLAIVAHSMGGLVARSAWQYAVESGLRWPSRLRHLVFIATPHHGAPLERGGHWLDLMLAATPYAAPLGRLGRIRSAGITDLRYGNLLDEDWQGRDRFAPGGDRRRVVALPAGPRCYAIAGTIGPKPGGVAVLGDGLVPLESALGRHRDTARRLEFPAGRQWVGTGMGHLDVLTRAEVWSRIGRWLAEGGGP